MKHELAHYERRDLWCKLFLLSTASFFWMNPIVYLIIKGCSLECEMACDELVLSSQDTEKGYEYGKALLQVVKEIHEKRRCPVSRLCLSMKGDFVSMKERLTALDIISSRKNRAGRTADRNSRDFRVG